MEESLAGSPKALSMTNESRLQLAEALQKEVEAFFVVPNLLWAMWSMAQSVSTKITFGYWVTNKDTKLHSRKRKKPLIFVSSFQMFAEERMQYYFHFKESCNF